MFSKWKIKGLDGFVFGEDTKLYRLPYTKGSRSYEVREIKLQYPNRYSINGQWLSKRQMKSRIYLDPNPVKIFETDNLPY